MPLTSIAFLTFLKRRQDSLMSFQVKHFKKEIDLELYINILIDLIENREKPNERIQLEGIVKYHAKHCTKPMDACNCQSLILDKEDETNGGSDGNGNSHGSLSH